MRQAPQMPAFDSRTHASYQVRVRGTMFLWGSAGITVNANFDPQVLLHIRNNVFGEAVTIGTQTANGNKQSLGTLQPGECFSIEIKNIVGVFATCALETNVDCLLHT